MYQLMTRMTDIKQELQLGVKVFCKFHYDNGFIYGAVTRNPSLMKDSPTTNSDVDVSILKLNDKPQGRHEWFSFIDHYFQWQPYNGEADNLLSLCTDTIECVRSGIMSTTVSDDYLLEIFRPTLERMQENMRSYRTKPAEASITEDYFIKTLQSILPKTAVRQRFCSMDDTTEQLGPKSEKCLFLRFQPIDTNNSDNSLAYKSKILHRKLFTWLVNNLCPFITVCDLEGGDCAYDVARQFYSVNGNGFEYKNVGYKSTGFKCSTHIFVKSILRTKKRRRVKKLLCCSAKTNKRFLVDSDNYAINEIGVLQEEFCTTTKKLPNQLKRLYRTKPQQNGDYSPLVIFLNEDIKTKKVYYNIMDATRFVVLWRFSELRPFTIRCLKLINRDFEICYCEDADKDKLRLHKVLRQKIKGCAKLEPYVVKVLKYVADTWAPGDRARMFRNQAVKQLIKTSIPSTPDATKSITLLKNDEDSGISLSEDEDSTKKVVSLDFVKFYPHVLLLLECDDVVSKFIERMLSIHTLDKRIKFDMNCTLGKLVHYNPQLYRAMKALSVCIMYDLTDTNCSPQMSSIGYCTDSVFLKVRDENNVNVDDLRLSGTHFDLDLKRTLPIKTENSFKKIAFMGGIDTYMGITTDDNTITKGFSCPRTKTTAEVKLVKALSETLLLSDENKPLIMVDDEQTACHRLRLAIEDVLDSLDVADYVYPGVQPPNVKYHPLVLFESCLCQDRMLVLPDEMIVKSVLGYNTDLQMKETDPYYDDHVNQTGKCFCDNCVASKLSKLFSTGKGMFVGSCLGIDYGKYAEKWLQVIMNMLGRILKHCRPYSDDDAVKTCDLQMNIMASLDKLFNDWVIYMKRFDFVPIAGTFQPRWM